MQRPPGYNQGFPGGMPMPNQGMPGQMPPNGYYGQPMPGMPGPPGPGFAQPGPGFAPPGQMPPQNQQNCFMPAAAIRKLSNTTPPRFDPCFK